MSAQHSAIAHRVELPFDHLVMVLTVAACGARQWSLRADGLTSDGQRPAQTSVASAFTSRAMATQLRAIADQIDQIEAQHGA